LYQSLLKKKNDVTITMISLRRRVFNHGENFVADCGITFVVNCPYA
jgi:hypothetical protein